MSKLEAANAEFKRLSAEFRQTASIAADKKSVTVAGMTATRSPDGQEWKYKEGAISCTFQVPPAHAGDDDIDIVITQLVDDMANSAAGHQAFADLV